MIEKIKENKGKSIALLLVLVLIIGGITAFAMTGNAEEPVVEVEPEVEEVVEVEIEEEEIEEEVYEPEEIPNTINFNVIVDQEVAESVLNVMNLTLFEREEFEHYYEFDIEDLLEPLVVEADTLSDSTYMVVSMRPPVTKDAELLVPEHLLKYDIEVEDGVPSLVDKIPFIICCFECESCEEMEELLGCEECDYCEGPELEIEEYEDLMTVDEDGNVFVELPLIVVPIEDQTAEELTYVIGEMQTWITNNPNADQEVLDRVQDSLDNAWEELEDREPPVIEDENNDSNNDTGSGGNQPPTTPNPPGGNQPPTTPNPPGGNQPPSQPPGGNQPPAACNHNWVGRYETRTETYVRVPGSPGTPGTPNQYGQRTVVQCTGCGATGDIAWWQGHRNPPTCTGSTSWVETYIQVPGTPGTPATPNQYGTREIQVRVGERCTRCGATR